ncbi:hypothetical protein PWT90_07761 [Aphanocladium album]|nr:hypothetical protein PWT90_07761 [Aphanocladium album]
MVTPPESHPLRKLRNCIAFSQKGSRDLPSQLSAGDLDGDLYNVIWDPQARTRTTFEPADYTRVAPPSLDRPVTREDIANFFIDFMKSDILGLIAIMHQIVADVQVEGTNDDDCIKLAEMHSTTVDYSKTGIAVNWWDMPRAPRSRADFHIMDDDNEDDVNDMGITKPRYYRSEKILGRLYRGIDEKIIWSEDIHRTIPTHGPSVWEKLMGQVQSEFNARSITAHYDLYHEQARKIRTLYEESISDSMWHFSENPRKSISEVEVFCGSILNRQGSQSRQQREASIRLKEETDRVLTWIVKLIHEGIKKNDEAVMYHEYESNDENDESSRAEYDALRLSWSCLVKRMKRVSQHAV